MMQSAASPGEKLANAILRAQGFEQLDFAAADLKQSRLYTLFLNSGGFRQPHAERVAPEFESLLETGDHNSHMMDSRQHRQVSTSKRIVSGRSYSASRATASSSRDCRGSDARCESLQACCRLRTHCPQWRG